jgi:hypothetical protein
MQHTLVQTLSLAVSHDPIQVLEELDQALTAVMVAKSVVQDVDKKICFGPRDTRARQLIGDGMAWGRAAVTQLCQGIVRVRDCGAPAMCVMWWCWGWWVVGEGGGHGQGQVCE